MLPDKQGYRLRRYRTSSMARVIVSDETRQKVLDAIAALNYRPNAVARGLVTSSTRKIGLVISEITNPFFTAVARGVEDETHQPSVQHDLVQHR